MAFTVVNQVSDVALKGDCPRVTLTQAASNAYLPTLAAGTLCTVASSTKTGYIDSIDTLGHSFKIRPLYPSTLLDSTTEPGILLAGETITIG